jgi:hypothetical protein
VPVTGSAARSMLPAFFVRAAEACKEAVTAHLAAHSADAHFERHVLFALATLTAAGAENVDPTDDDLSLLRDVCDAAAAVCRTEQPDDGLVAVAACFQETVHACDGALGRTAEPSRWQRFLFKDADVTILRLPRAWRVRNGSMEAREKLLDVALDDVLPLSSHRIAELTVQILAWHTHDPAFPD